MMIAPCPYNNTDYKNNIQKYVSQPAGRITHLEAMDNYCYIHYVDGSKELICKCLKHLFESETLKHFIKTHRKYVVNPIYVQNYLKEASAVRLSTNKMITVSRSKRKAIHSIFH